MDFSNKTEVDTGNVVISMNVNFDAVDTEKRVI